MTLAVSGIFLLLMISGTASADYGSQSETDRAKPTAKPDTRCWKGTEKANPDAAGRKAPLLPKRFDDAKVLRTVVVVKLCIDHTGQVSRTIVLTSSGNDDVDQFYRDALKKWTFKPLSNDGVTPSIATISVNWNPR